MEETILTTAGNRSARRARSAPSFHTAHAHPHNYSFSPCHKHRLDSLSNWHTLVHSRPVSWLRCHSSGLIWLFLKEFHLAISSISLLLRSAFPLENIFSSPSRHTTHHSFQWFQFILKFGASHFPVSNVCWQVRMLNHLPFYHVFRITPAILSFPVFLFLSPALLPGWPVLGHQFRSMLVVSITVLDSETCSSYLSRTSIQLGTWSWGNLLGLPLYTSLDPDLCWFMIPLLLCFTHRESGYC